MDVAIGVFIVVVGVALAVSGVYRFLRPRRPADADWIRRHPRSNWALGGLVLGFDRNGALASLGVGVVAVLVGVTVLVAA